MRAVRNVLAFVSFLLVVIFLIFSIFTFLTPEMEGKGVAVTLTILFLVLGFILKVPSNYSVELKKRNEEKGIITSSVLHHVEGLPLSEKTQCAVSVSTTGLIIEGGGTDFNISASQIRAVEVKTDTEIANIVHSSAAKGIAGGLLFGPIGLIVGSRATSKEKRTNTYYLIINYTNSNGEIAALMFDGGASPLGPQKIANKLRPIVRDNPKQVVQL